MQVYVSNRLAFTSLYKYSDLGVEGGRQWVEADRESWRGFRPAVDTYKLSGEVDIL